MDSKIDFNEIFNDSYDFVLANDDAFFEEFYRIFIASSDEVRKAFNKTDMERQKDMLRESLATMITFFVTKIADVSLIRVAKLHRITLAISDNLFDLFLNSLLTTLRNLYPRYNALCGLAWRITLAPSMELMKHPENFLTENQKNI